MPNVSSITAVLPLRVPNELLERLEAMTELLGARRNDIGREALERGLEQLEAQHTGQKPLPGKRRAAKAAPAQVPTKPAEPGVAVDLTLKTWAFWVMESARRCPSGRVGDDRVFISHVWRKYKAVHKPKGDLEGFKQSLIEANQARFLSLASADEIPMLEQKDLRESETRYLSARFHFLCL